MSGILHVELLDIQTDGRLPLQMPVWQRQKVNKDVGQHPVKISSHSAG